MTDNDSTTVPSPTAAAGAPAGVDAATAGPPTLTPTERLQQSRERMAQWMVRADGRHLSRRRAQQAAGTAAPRREWLGKLRDNPIVGVLADTFNSWWGSHPLHGVATLAADLAREAAAPLARRHPRALVAGAVITGAVIVWTRPWRWLRRPALFGGIVSQLGSHFMAQIPIESILGALHAFASSHAAEPPPSHPVPPSA